MGWLSRWFSHSVETRWGLVADIDRNALYHPLHRVISEMTGDADVVRELPGTLDGFARVAIRVGETRFGSELSHALIEVAVGRTRTVSVPAWNWSMLVNGPSTFTVPEIDPAAWAFKPTRWPASRRVPPDRHAGSRAIPSTHWEQSLRAALSDDVAGGGKLTASMVLGRLDRLPERDSVTSPAEALISWYRELLSEEKPKPSSVRRYHAAIGRAWLGLSGGLDLADIGDGVLDELYERAIERRASPEGRSYDAGRWNQFHEHPA